MEHRSSGFSLQIAGLFIFFAFCTLYFAIIDAMLYPRVARLALLYPIDRFLPDTLSKLGVTGGCAVFLYVFYRLDKRGGYSRWLRIGQFVLAIPLVVVAGKVDFFFARLLLVGGAFILVATGTAAVIARSSIARLLRGVAFVASWIVISISGIEAFLVLKNIDSYGQSVQTIGGYDFFDTLAVGDADSPGQLQKNLNSPLLLGDGSFGLIKTNAQGFRSEKDLELPKPDTEFRILFLGDSFTVGYRSDQEKYAAGIVQRELNRRLRANVQIYAAMTVDQFGLLNFVRKYPQNYWQADLILHGVCLGNDIGTSYFKSGIDQRKVPHVSIPPEYLDPANFDPNSSDSPDARIPEIQKSSRILGTYRLLFKPTPIWPTMIRRFGATNLWNGQNNIGLFVKDEKLHAPFYAKFEDHLLAIHQAVAGVPFHVFVFPQRSQQSTAEWEAQVRYDGLRRDSFELDRPNRRIAEMCARHNWKCNDLLPAFRKNGDRVLHLPFDMHWNDAGNALAGQEIADYLEPIVRTMLAAPRT